LVWIVWDKQLKNPVVRKSSISALQELYAVDDNVPSLSLFTARFGRRMVEMADDVDMSVAISAIGLLKQLLRLVDATCLFCFLNVVISYILIAEC
jgi:hypothetical protein